MPAFTFEKIAPPERIEHVSEAPESRRSAIVRLLDRLTAARLQKSEDDARKMQRLKHKYRKQT